MSSLTTNCEGDSLLINCPGDSLVIPCPPNPCCDCLDNYALDFDLEIITTFVQDCHGGTDESACGAGDCGANGCPGYSGHQYRSLSVSNRGSDNCPYRWSTPDGSTVDCPNNGLAFNGNDWETMSTCNETVIFGGSAPTLARNSTNIPCPVGTYDGFDVTSPDPIMFSNGCYYTLRVIVTNVVIS